jgi:ABC-2 type transport system ATP-binding protein
MAPDREIVVARGLSKTFSTGWPWKKIRALSDLDLTVREGEILGYLGPNGAGKTTTLKLIMGLIRATRGEITVGGLPPSNPAARRMAGFLPENPYFYEYLTGREFLYFTSRLGGGRRRATDRSMVNIIERVGLVGAADLPLRKYSKGMLQRIGLAQALVTNPSLLVLDEPLSGLDPIGRREIRDLILELKAEGKTIFFSSHILADAEMICDRVAFLNQGRLVMVGKLKELLSPEGGMVEVRTIGLGDEQVKALQEKAMETVRAQEETIFVIESYSFLTSFLETAGKMGGKVVSINPRRESLEDFFMKLMEGGAS